MLNFRLDKQALVEMRMAHHQAEHARAAHHINAMILLGDGWKVADVAGALLIDADTVMHLIFHAKSKSDIF